MKLKFKAIKGYDDIQQKKFIKEGTVMEFDHLDKRAWELVRAGLIEQVE